MCRYGSENLVKRGCYLRVSNINETKDYLMAVLTLPLWGWGWWCGVQQGRLGLTIRPFDLRKFLHSFVLTQFFCDFASTLLPFLTAFPRFFWCYPFTRLISFFKPTAIFITSPISLEASQNSSVRSSYAWKHSISWLLQQWWILSACSVFANNSSPMFPKETRPVLLIFRLIKIFLSSNIHQYFHSSSLGMTKENSVKNCFIGRENHKKNFWCTQS